METYDVFASITATRIFKTCLAVCGQKAQLPKKIHFRY